MRVRVRVRVRATEVERHHGAVADGAGRDMGEIWKRYGGDMGGVTTGRLRMEPAEHAYCSVRRLSSAKATSGVQHAIIIVTAVPPRQSERSLVSVESRYGT